MQSVEPKDILLLKRFTIFAWCRCINAQCPLVFEQLPFDHQLYILYSSGIKGTPKCIVHNAGTGGGVKNGWHWKQSFLSSSSTSVNVVLKRGLN